MALSQRDCDFVDGLVLASYTPGLGFDRTYDDMLAARFGFGRHARGQNHRSSETDYERVVKELDRDLTL